MCVDMAPEFWVERLRMSRTVVVVCQSTSYKQSINWIGIKFGGFPMCDLNFLFLQPQIVNSGCELCMAISGGIFLNPKRINNYLDK